MLIGHILKSSSIKVLNIAELADLILPFFQYKKLIINKIVYALPILKLKNFNNNLLPVARNNIVIIIKHKQDIIRVADLITDNGQCFCFSLFFFTAGFRIFTNVTLFT
jgi:hypothetical protein